MRYIVNMIITAASRTLQRAFLMISQAAVMMMGREVMIQHRSPGPKLKADHGCLVPISVTQKVLLETCTLSDTVVRSKRRLGGEGICNTCFIPLLNSNDQGSRKDRPSVTLSVSWKDTVILYTLQRQSYLTRLGTDVLCICCSCCGCISRASTGERLSSRCRLRCPTDVQTEYSG